MLFVVINFIFLSENMENISAIKYCRHEQRFRGCMMYNLKVSLNMEVREMAIILRVQERLV